MNYVEHAKEKLVGALGEEYAVEKDLLDLYTLLVLVKGKDCTLEDVHEAWSVWTNKSRPQHNSLIPFAYLSEDIKEYDRPYATAIIIASQQ